MIEQSFTLRHLRCLIVAQSRFSSYPVKENCEVEARAEFIIEIKF
ncbi:MAG: hypothetical protein JWN98_1511 [Abditibacteriota bacterium]|nr:hypothetical protein [Abditibacteriota bacterium]